MRLLCGAIAAAMLLAQATGSVDTRALLAKPRQRVETADYRASGRLVRVDANGNRISFPITIKAHWFPGVLKVQAEIGTGSKPDASSPAGGHIPVHILLEMRPSGQNSIMVAHPGDKAPAALAFDKWSDGPLGSAFSYEDFLEPEYFWPGQMSQGEVKYGARDCDLIKSTPGATDRTHYAEVKSWLDHGIGFPVYVEKTLKESAAVKEYTYFGLRQVGGVWSASQVEAKVRGVGGSNLLIIDRGSTKANLEAKDFTAAQLVHF